MQHAEMRLRVFVSAGHEIRPATILLSAQHLDNLRHNIRVRMKALADRVDPEIFQREHRDHRLDAPKAIDNAIVNYVTLTAGLA